MPKKSKPKEEYFEIIPTSTFGAEKKSAELEKEIDEIKGALRGTVGLSKFGESAEKFMAQILELLTNSQKMTSEVAQTNKELSAQIQAALDTMNRTNAALSEKLTKILDYFAEATEVEAGEAEELGASLSKEMAGVKAALQTIVEQNKKTHQLLMLIEKNLRGAAPRPAPMPRPSAPRPAPQRAPPTSGAPPLEPGELPPPPFPP